MRNPGGYGVIIDPDKGLTEFDTITCNHCQRIVHVGAGQDPSTIGGFCLICMKHICEYCQGRMAQGFGCVPWEKKMEQIEARDRARKSYGV